VCIGAWSRLAERSKRVNQAINKKDRAFSACTVIAQSG
jgi:hypothetical protein